MTTDHRPPGARRSGAPTRNVTPLRRPAPAIALVLAAMAAAGPAAAAETFLTPLGPIAEGQRAHFFLVIGLIALAILPVLIGTPLIFWRYRRSNTRASYTPKWEFNRWLEGAMWTVPTVIIVVMGVIMVGSTTRLDPYRPLPGEPVKVDVVGLDWKWLFVYPDQGVASVGELVLPVGRPVAMRITSDTVMQSFFVPALAGQIYAMPGMRTKLHLQADALGDTRGENTQYNGVGFSGQRFPVRIVDEAAFETWTSPEDAPSLTDETYATLARRGSVADLRAALALEGEGPVRFRLDGTDLFDRVLDRYHDGDAVTPEEQPGSPAYAAERSLLPLFASATTSGFCGPVLPGITLARMEPTDG